MCAQTWKDPEINQIRNQNQANQDNWPKETWKNCCIKVIQTTMREKVSLSSPMCLSTCTFFPPNKHFFCITGFHLAEIYFYKADVPRPCHWPLFSGGLVARFYCPHCPVLTSINGWGTETLPQAAAGWGHLISQSIRFASFAQCKAMKSSLFFFLPQLVFIP